ncbi:hypothetical protein Tco_0998849 [Tanacetum coccineum]
MSTPTFAETHNLVAFLEKPTEGEGFEHIVDFLNANPIKYALTIQALVDGKKVIVNEASIRRDLRLDDAEGTACLPNDTIFEELARMGAKTTAWNEFSSTMASVIICLANNQKFNFSKYIFESMLKNLDGGVKKSANMKREGKGFSGVITPLFDTMMVQAAEEKKHKSRRTQRKEIEVPQDESPNEESVPTPFNDPLPSGKDRMQLTELMGRMIDNIDQDKEINLVDETQGRMNDQDMFGFNDLDGDEVVVDDSADKSEEQSVKVPEKEVREVSIVDPVTTAGEVVTTANVRVTTVSTPTTTIDEMTLAQTLIEIKAANLKLIKNCSKITTVTAVVTRPKAKGVVMQEPSETLSPKLIVSFQNPSQHKDKGKEKMVEPERPLKKKEQIMMDELMARDLAAQLQAEMEEEDRAARLKEEEDNIALIESWENTQAMMEADYELAKSLQAQEQGELTIEEKSKLFVELMKKRKKHFAELRAQEKRNKPPTKAQKRNLMSTYLKNMGGFKYTQMKSKTYEEIEKLFEIEMKRVNSFIPMDSEVEKSSMMKAQESSVKRGGAELEQEKAKKQKLDENVEVEVDDFAELKSCLEIVPEDEDDVTVDAT